MGEELRDNKLSAIQISIPNFKMFSISSRTVITKKELKNFVVGFSLIICIQTMPKSSKKLKMNWLLFKICSCLCHQSYHRLEFLISSLSYELLHKSPTSLNGIDLTMIFRTKYC